jgi:hypothetical protein
MANSFEYASQLLRLDYHYSVRFNTVQPVDAIQEPRYPYLPFFRNSPITV